MSATATTPSAPPPHQKPAKTLACVHCQYRKIKCDRQFPCANCTKARVECKPSTPAPPHKRRRPNQDLLERLARCEKLLKQYADGGGQPVPDAADTTSPNSDPLLAQYPVPGQDSKTVTALKKPGTLGLVVEEDGNMRFMDNYLRISFHDEIKAMRSIIDVDEFGSESENSPTTALSPDNHGDLFMGMEESQTDLRELQPDLVSVFRLWQMFIDRVNPLTKVIHIPTVQQYVVDGATDITKVPLNYQALIFSIYAAATLSLTSQEAIQHLNMTQDEALRRYIRATKLALIRMNFMKNHNMVALQALCLYLVTINGHYDRHSTWIFGGTVVRIAQKMGYHRDGELLGLTPYETEMRRRIWWHIIASDGKQAMMTGLSHAFAPSHWDTKLPLNLNDADLSPTSVEPLVAKEGPTDMVFVLLIYIFQKFIHSTYPQLEAAWLALRSEGASPDYRAPIENYRTLIGGLDLEMTEFEHKNVEPGLGGVHEAASMMRPMFIEKMKESMVAMKDQPEYGTEIFDPVDSIFKSFVISHERNSLSFKRMKNQGFLWFMKMGFQIDAFMVMLSKLYKHPTGVLATRTWNVIESLHSMHEELFDTSERKYAITAALTLKAWGAREMALERSGIRIDVPEYIQRLRNVVSSPRDSIPMTDTSISPNSAAAVWTSEAAGAYPQMSRDLMDTSSFLNTNADVATLGIDMWGNLLVDNDAAQFEQQQSMLPYGPLDFGKINFEAMDFANGFST
ncbi:fungal-specific transcription factor domain-containing protein [Xylariaceae sp. FL1272]|nr:fungal-specific transcription factor domain-containing protein [Xylariaceae sp. FL1272]